MLCAALKLTPYNNPVLGRIHIKRTTEVEVITGDRESFLAACAQVWDQHHGETP